METPLARGDPAAAPSYAEMSRSQDAGFCTRYDNAGWSMSKRANTVKRTPSSKKTLKKLFDERDRTRPGSRENEKTAEEILVAIFPDANADSSTNQLKN